MVQDFRIQGLGLSMWGLVEALVTSFGLNLELH